MAAGRAGLAAVAAGTGFVAAILTATLIPVPVQAAGDAKRGEELAAIWCSSCHQLGVGDPPHGFGPPFSTIALNPRYTADYIRDWVTHPHATMPNYLFSKRVLDDLVAFIHSLRPDRGSDCPACEGTSGDRKFAVGSGFYIGRNGDVVTAEHNVRECARVTVDGPGQGMGSASLGYSDGSLDLALLKTGRRREAHARIRLWPPLKLGEQVLVYSFPLSGLLSSGGTLSPGVVSALTGVRDSPHEFQMSAEIHHGSSGGPVLDRWGRVIGVAKSRLVLASSAEVPAPGINFAVNLRSLSLFLAAAGHPLPLAEGGQPLPAEAIAATAVSFAVRVTCWR